MNDFEREISHRVRAAQTNERLRNDARAFTASSIEARYSYNFHWLGRPVIQYPQDMVALQEIIWSTRPDLVIETGIAHGGSLVLSASLLALLDLADAAAAGTPVDPRLPRRRVIGVDIDIRSHNREAIQAHPLAPRITLVQGSSTAADVVQEVRRASAGHERIMVCLDSNHTHAHVLDELRAYAPLVTPGCYCIVFDTVIEQLPLGSFADRPWDIGDNPATAIAAWMAENDDFEVDREIDARLQVSVAPGGYLRRRETTQPSRR
ncbi:MAG: cephalosporin hydroxylase family protein [Dokdonella sp.]|uniref:cephalosporin hydroxylase family protein n=1 Tax=Dokdonella sp. TaxID=2291710 RepID=UPI003F805750